VLSSTVLSSTVHSWLLFVCRSIFFFEFCIFAAIIEMQVQLSAVQNSGQFVDSNEGKVWGVLFVLICFCQSRLLAQHFFCMMPPLMYFKLIYFMHRFKNAAWPQILNVLTKRLLVNKWEAALHPSNHASLTVQAQ
jgi:hypothetical protein